MNIAFPGESAEYRTARDQLLAQEVELRRAMEAVAAARRALPVGGLLGEDYVLRGAGADGDPAAVRFSELFAPGQDSLVVYSMMFPRDPGDDRPGPRLRARARLAAPAPALLGRNHVQPRLPRRDPEGRQTPMLNVFHRDGDGIRHFWGSELFYAPTEPGQDTRHVGTLEPVWNIFDLNREGRRPDWDEQLHY